MDSSYSASDLHSYLDSEDSDSAAATDGVTIISSDGVINRHFQGVNIQADKGGFNHAPQLRNIQVGNGRVTIIGGAVPRTSREPPIRRYQERESRAKTTSSSKPSKCLTDSQLPPSVSDLNHICNNVGKAWKKMARALGFSRANIETIQLDYSAEGVYEMAWQTILKWRRKHVDDVRLCDIARTLDGIGLEQLARELPVDP